MNFIINVQEFINASRFQDKFSLEINILL
jgi:hypothetical protein